MPEGHLFNPLVVRRFAPNKQRILIIRPIIQKINILYQKPLSFTKSIFSLKGCILLIVFDILDKLFKSFSVKYFSKLDM